jgi:hypothetical protein
MVDSASLEDNREFEDSTRHDDIEAAWQIIVLAAYEADDDKLDDQNLNILKTACETALKEIAKIEGTKY